MKGKGSQELKEATKELQQSIHLVRAPESLQKDTSLTLPIIKEKVSRQTKEDRMQE